VLCCVVYALCGVLPLQCEVMLLSPPFLQGQKEGRKGWRRKEKEKELENQRDMKLTKPSTGRRGRFNFHPSGSKIHVTKVFI